MARRCPFPCFLFISFFRFFSPFSSDEKGGNNESDSSDTLDTGVRLSLKKYINDHKKIGSKSGRFSIK